ncbi:MAG: sigma-70 family RNA polymerase sigma factor [Myxococcales bacterium]|nr:sigma-70 family RNA polymerase sigma factor [Myxococcales bacterium]
MSDDDLLDRWRAGDAEAGEQLFAAHFEGLRRFFTNKTNEPDELVQATFLACVRAVEHFRKQSSFRTYLFAIARNTLLHHLRVVRRDQRLDPEHSSIAELITTPGSNLARRQDRLQILAALRQLSVEQQTLLELHYWEELDAADLAEVFQAEVGTIRVRLHRARAALRAVLEAMPARSLADAALGPVEAGLRLVSPASATDG